jgi:hypothetical protein
VVNGGVYMLNCAEVNISLLLPMKDYNGSFVLCYTCILLLHRTYTVDTHTQGHMFPASSTKFCSEKGRFSLNVTNFRAQLYTILHSSDVYCYFRFTWFHFDITIV